MTGWNHGLSRAALGVYARAARRLNVVPYNLVTVLALPKRLQFEVFPVPRKLAAHESQLSLLVLGRRHAPPVDVTARQHLLQRVEATPA
jgi:hypothetical protein